MQSHILANNKKSSCWRLIASPISSNETHLLEFTVKIVLKLIKLIRGVEKMTLANAYGTTFFRIDISMQQPIAQQKL